jgi:predicted TIM-barrel fold metal-dependent hydrolase
MLLLIDNHTQAAEAPVEGAFHIYLIIGDEEMAGRNEISEEDANILARCYVLNDQDKWEPAKAPLNRYSTIKREGEPQQLGLAYYFAKDMLERNPDLAIGLVVNAGKDWEIDKWGAKSPAYRGARGRAKQARRSGAIKGVLWKSKPTKTNAPIALDYLKDIIAALRADLRLLDLPVVVGELAASPAYNNQMKALQEDVHAIGIAHNPTDIKLQGQSYAHHMTKLLQNQNTGSLEPGMPVIDIHVHARDVRPDGLDALDRWMKRNNVEIAISHPLRQSKFKDAQQREQMLANYEKYKGRIYRFCLVEPTEVDRVEEAVAILERELADGAIGMGEHYGHDMMFDDPRNMILYAACEKVGLPVMFHIDRNKNMDEKGLPRVEKVLQRFPKLKLLAHAAWWSHFPEGTCERLMQEYPNLYADVSAITKVLNRDRTYTREFVLRNQDRILFATDAGWWSFGSPIDERELEFTIFERLDLSKEVKEKIYRTNAQKLFGFK